ncbi:hypothetical protein EUGRSUZ_E02471 [Eucalyptus grandis]|uniref:Uncharacterized protein n=2 Tax=Eucalyptus grandis TaxID=71139 RepID=A0ACC3KWD6_EUCGR|nr:hypothetical protein EUGRSUZ_E02471 [Eucalyptus grandis]
MQEPPALLVNDEIAKHNTDRESNSNAYQHSSPVQVDRILLSLSSPSDDDDSKLSPSVHLFGGGVPHNLIHGK